MPACLAQLCLFIAVNGYLHTIIEHTVRLVVIQNVELDRDAGPSVRHLKVKPLGVPTCICVVLH